MGVFMTINVHLWIAGVGLAGGSALAAAVIGVGVAPIANATGDDSVGIAGSTVSDTAVAVSSGNQFDPAVIPYSPDPSNLFAPVYTIAPVGPEQAISTVTDPNNVDTTDTFGTQDFSLSSLGFPVDTFTGNVEYTPTPFDAAAGSAGILSQLSQELGFGGGYSEEIFTSGGTGTVLPDEFDRFPYRRVRVRVRQRVRGVHERRRDFVHRRGFRAHTVREREHHPHHRFPDEHHRNPSRGHERC